MSRSLNGGPPRTNGPFAVLAGALLALADMLLQPAIVLVFFVSELEGSNRQIAAIFTVGMLGWLLPRWLAPWFMSGRSRQMPLALGASLVRAASAIFLAYVGYRDDLSDEQRLRSFFICFAAYSVAAGFAHQPVGELIARASRADGARAVLRWRALTSGILVLAAAAVAPGVFGVDGPEFPRNVALFFIVAAAAASAATFFVARVKETPPSPLAMQQPALRPGDLARVAGDRTYVRLAIFGVFAAAATLADPFYLVHARGEFELPASWIGRLFAVYALGLVLSAPLWGWLIRQTGPRAALQLSTACRVLAPLLLVFLPYLIESDLYRDRVTDPEVVFWIVTVPFAILGIALRGFVAGNTEYVNAISVPARRAAYGAMVLVPVAVAAIAPLFAAEIIERWGFERLFLVALLVGFAAVVAGGLLVDATLRVRQASQAWRLDSARS